MSCTATSSYLTLLPYYQNESKSNIHDQFIQNLKSYYGSHLFGKHWSQPCLISQKNRYPRSIGRHQRNSHETLIFHCLQIDKIGQHSVPRWIYLAITIPTLTVVGVGIIAVYYKCKRGPTKIYRLARNGGKTMETPGYNAVAVYTGDRYDV